MIERGYLAKDSNLTTYYKLQLLITDATLFEIRVVSLKGKGTMESSIIIEQKKILEINISAVQLFPKQIILKHEKF